MKTTFIRIPLAGALLVSALSLAPSALLQAATTINAGNHYAHGANVGWMDWRGDVASGAVIREYVCSGYIYAANVGWIRLGGGAPANGIQYQNNSAGDYGVNLDGSGNLRGYAYGANIGWVNFESTGAPRVDLVTGRFIGYAWSANCGWISLSNAVAFVQTDTILAGTDTDSDGIADAWERTYTNSLTAFTATSDTDHDGMTEKQEYLAGTNPLNANDLLKITGFARAGVHNILEWTSKPTRLYRVQRRTGLGDASQWEELSLGSENLLGWNNIGFDNTGPRYFYRIRAARPLAP